MVGISTRFGTAMNGRKQQLHHHHHQVGPTTTRRRRTAGGNGNGNNKRTPTLWIGMSMFCLVFVYAAVILIVTRSHWSNSTSSSSSNVVESTDDIVNNNNNPVNTNKQTFKQKLQTAKQKQQQQQQDEIPKIKGNAVRKHHLELEFGAGVVPHKLAAADHEDTADDKEEEDDEAHIAYKDDPPVNQHPTPDYVLRAYLEPLNYDDWKITPLPVRSQAKKENLKMVEYTRLNSCSKLTQQWPVDDTPTDHDPFLPWIHDVFPSNDGKYIQFVAQNKRRCKTGSKETDILAHMAPQAALFQHVSVKRTTANDGDSDNRDGQHYNYQLVPHSDADPDAIATRYICRFKPDMQETLSEFNFDYEWTSYRKRYKVNVDEFDGGIKHIHMTQLLFRCPVPEELQERVRTGETVKNDWASLFVDLIPIRTAPRWGTPNQYLQPKYSEFQETDPQKAFDPKTMWGDQHILPLIQDSGRWENIPICKPGSMEFEPEVVVANHAPAKKKHRLASCIWASAGYTTRGNRFAVNDGQRRLLEWISHNKLIGFDHFYLYDNSGAFGSDASLKAIADLFPDDVTYVPWPSQICNNNPNNVDSVGERSSQYAAESSCRLRFGDNVDWFGQFDIDEYLIPMGDHNNITSLLDELDKEDTRIISFGSWRAWPRFALIEEPERIHDKEVCWSPEPCFQLQIPMKHTMLQAYNCDRQKPGQKTSTMPAEKQLYKADYVLQHFVHYSSVTVLSEKNKTEYEKEGFRWKPRAFPDPRQRFGDEVKEGLMVHTKAVARQDTAGWERVCHIDNLKQPKRRQGLCRLGVPWPDDPEEAKKNATEEGWAFNCFVNEKVEKYLVPRLEESLKKHEHFFDIE